MSLETQTTDTLPELSLVIPGLLGASWLPPMELGVIFTGAVPVLCKFLSRSQEQLFPPISGFEEILFPLFQVPKNPQGYFPVAPVAYGGEQGSLSSDEFIMRADPVRLIPDGDSLLMLGNEELDIELEEAQQLAAELNTFYQDEGWYFEAPHPKRWYLRLKNGSHRSFAPLDFCIGKYLNGLLPQDQDAKSLRVLLNEIQMILHRSPVNERREQKGRYPINSLWFWGGGYAPKLGQTEWQHIFASETTALGLARLAAIPVTDPINHAVGYFQHLPRGKHLVYLPQLLPALVRGDGPAFYQALQQMEQQWFLPIDKAVANKKLSVVNLIGGTQQQFKLTPKNLGHWWRRGQSYRYFYEKNH